MSLAADCLIGAWELDGNCEPNICPQPGACCLPDTSCIVALKVECSSDNWAEGETCSLANCPAPDCNENGISDIQDIADGPSDDCNENSIPDECDIIGAGKTTVFAEGMKFPQDIVASQGEYPPGFLVTDTGDFRIYFVPPSGGAAITFAPSISFPIGATFAPDEFGRLGDRLFATCAGCSADGPTILLITPHGTERPFASLASNARATGIAYIPEAIGGIAAGKLFVTAQADTAGNFAGSIHLVDAVGTTTTLISSFGSSIFSQALAPSEFGQFANQVFLSLFGSELIAFDLSTMELFPFATVPLPSGDLGGFRQIAFSPIGWGAPFDPALINERVLLVSVASGATSPFPGAGLVSAWDQRGRMLAALTVGPDGLSFQPRGLVFVKNDLLISDGADGHGWLVRATIADFGLPDCDGDGILDECEIAGGSNDCNDNAIPDECEVDCNGNGVADPCDLVDGFASDCNRNFIPDSCEEPDCNKNGLPDSCDLADGTSRDLNRNQIPDECDTFVGDFDVDQDTDLDDYAALESCLSVSGPGVTAVPEICQTVFDFDVDGDVDLLNVALFQVKFTGSGE